MKPFLKWAGGKRQIMNYIKPYIEQNLQTGNRYYEPFVGGGSVFITLEQANCVINDLNSELMNCYNVIKKNPKELINILKIHQENHHKDVEYYYQVRKVDRDESIFNQMSDIEKAARMIYLNKTCYNGLYRVNKKGYFNTPKGRYVNPNIVDEDNILNLHKFFNESKVTIRNTSFAEAVKDASKGDFIYFDPPYDYEDSGFTKYVKEGFEFEDLKNLKTLCDNLINKGCFVLISNNATNRVIDLFDSKNYEIVALAKYDLEELDVRRFIGAKAEDRKIVKEVLIYGRKKSDISSSKLNK